MQAAVVTGPPPSPFVQGDGISLAQQVREEWRTYRSKPREKADPSAGYPAEGAARGLGAEGEGLLGNRRQHGNGDNFRGKGYSLIAAIAFNRDTYGRADEEVGVGHIKGGGPSGHKPSFPIGGLGGVAHHPFQTVGSNRTAIDQARSVAKRPDGGVIDLNPASTAAGIRPGAIVLEGPVASRDIVVNGLPVNHPSPGANEALAAEAVVGEERHARCLLAQEETSKVVAKDGVVIFVRGVGIPQGFFCRLQSETIRQLAEIRPDDLFQGLEQSRVGICKDIHRFRIAQP